MKKLILLFLLFPQLVFAQTASKIADLSEKTAVVADDITNILDSEDSNDDKKMTVSNLSKYTEGVVASAFSSGANVTAPLTEQLVSLESGHGWTKQSAAGTQTDDTTNYVKETQSLKLTTDGDNAAVFNRKSSITPTIDMTGKAFVLWVRTDSVEDMTEFTFYASSDNFSNFWYWQIKNSFTQDEDEWFPITLSWTDAVASGSPDRTAINSFQWRVRDDGTGSINANLGGIYAVNEAKGGVVSITFDDNWESQFTQARKLMDPYGFRGTVYTMPDSVGTAGYMTLDELKVLEHQSGWDISGHYETNLTTVPDPDEVVKGVRSWLANNEFRQGANEFAYPNGAWDNDVLAAVRKYFRSGRSIQEFAEQPVPADIMRMKVFLVVNTTTTTQIADAVTDAINNNDWLILVFHKIVTTPGASTEYSIANFTTVMADIADQGIAVKPVSEVLNQETTEAGEAVFGYMSSASDTTITTADTWYIFQSTFTNPVLDNFTASADGITYNGSGGTFEIEWGTCGIPDTATVVKIGVVKNGTFTGTELTSGDVLAGSCGGDEAINPPSDGYVSPRSLWAGRVEKGDVFTLVITAEDNGVVYTPTNAAATIHKLF